MIIRTPLTPEQVSYLNSKKPHVCFFGGRGSGKTYVSMLKLITMPPTDCYYIVPIYRNIHDVSLATLRKIDAAICAKGGTSVIKKERMSDYSVELISGTVVHFRGADNWPKLRGISTSTLFLDEAAEVSNKAWDVISAILREGECRIYITTTPKGKNNWTYKFAVAKAIDTDMIVAPTRSNPFLREDYVLRLSEQYTSDFAKQELDGEFIDKSALIRPEWIRYAASPTKGYTVVGVDPAISMSDTGDRTAISVIRASDDYVSPRHVVYMTKFRATFAAILDKIDCVCKEFSASAVAIEDVAFQAALVQSCQQRGLPVVPSRPVADKVARFMATAAALEFGRIVFDPSCATDCIDEIQNFPNCEHDDVPDSLAYAHNLIQYHTSSCEPVFVKFGRR